MEFLRKMHDDVLDIIKTRNRVSFAKVTTLASLAGVSFYKGIGLISRGTEKTTENDSTGIIVLIILAIIPLVAIMWDFIFFEQDFALKRIACFVRTKMYDSPLEWKWEHWLADDSGKLRAKGLSHSYLPVYGVTFIAWLLCLVLSILTSAFFFPFNFSITLPPFSWLLSCIPNQLLLGTITTNIYLIIAITYIFLACRHHEKMRSFLSENKKRGGSSMGSI